MLDEGDYHWTSSLHILYLDLFFSLLGYRLFPKIVPQTGTFYGENRATLAVRDPQMF